MSERFNLRRAEKAEMYLMPLSVTCVESKSRHVNRCKGANVTIVSFCMFVKAASKCSRFGSRASSPHA